MPRNLGRISNIPVFPSLPSSPETGDVCIVNETEYVCLTPGEWRARTSGANPVWESPSIVSGYTYSLQGAASTYLLLIDGDYVLEPGADYTTSGNQFTITSRLVRAMIDTGSNIRAFRLSTNNFSIPSGFFPDVPPASPHSLNLEFGSLSGLTEWDPGNRYTLNLIESGVSIRTESAPGGVEWGGAYFSLPSGTQWSLFAKCGFVGAHATDLRAVNWGIGLLQNTTNSSALVTLANGWTGPDPANGRNTHVYVTLWSSYTTFSSELGAVYYGAHDEMATYFRITRDGSNYTFWFSRAGAYWSPLYTGSLPWTPAVGAILISNSFNRAGLGAAGHFYHVRFTNSAAIDQAYPGRRF